MQSTPAADLASNRADARRALLAELAEIGMTLARDLRREADEAAAGGQPASDVGLRFTRIARAVRQTLALEARLEAESEELAQRQRAQAARAAEADQRAQRRAGWARRHEGTEIVERLIAAEYGPGEAERREDEIADWLEDSEDPAYLDLPMGEIVLAICRDLGLCIDWRRWAGAEWGLEAAAAEAAGKPSPTAAAAPAWLADFTAPPPGLAAGPPPPAVLAPVPS